MNASESPPNREQGGVAGPKMAERLRKDAAPMMIWLKNSLKNSFSDKKERTKVQIGESKKLISKRSKTIDSPNPGYAIVRAEVMGWKIHVHPKVEGRRRMSGDEETTPEAARSNHPA